MSLLEVGLLAILVGCFVGAAILAAAEVSIIRVRRGEVLAEVESGAARSRQLLRLVDDLPRVLNTVLLVVLLLQLTAAAIGGILADRWFGGLGVTLATVILTGVLFIYAEAIPKTRAMQSPYRTALRLAPLLRFLVRFLRPVVATLVWLADIQTPGDANFGAATEQEIRAIARESAEVGAIEPDDAELVDRSFEFNDRCVEEVMVGRDRIAAVGHDESVSDVLARAIALGHRRLPVFRDGLDDITGVVRLRDVAATAGEAPDAEVSSIMSGVLRCEPGEPISELLGRMQRRGQWVAIVTDADGTTLGLATVEDLVAELVGEIEDVHVARRPDGADRTTAE